MRKNMLIVKTKKMKILGIISFEIMLFIEDIKRKTIYNFCKYICVNSINIAFDLPFKDIKKFIYNEFTLGIKEYIRCKDLICSICLDETNDVDEHTKCDYHYHKKCLDKWLETHITCPMCKTEIKEKPKCLCSSCITTNMFRLTPLIFADEGNNDNFIIHTQDWRTDISMEQIRSVVERNNLSRYTSIILIADNDNDSDHEHILSLINSVVRRISSNDNMTDNAVDIADQNFSDYNINPVQQVVNRVRRTNNKNKNKKRIKISSTIKIQNNQMKNLSKRQRKRMLRNPRDYKIK